MNMTLNTTTTPDCEALEWVQIGTSEDTLNNVLSDCGIVFCEPQSFPLTDGIVFYIIDRDGKPRFLEISIAEGLLFDANFDGVPLVVRLSSPIVAK